MGYCELKVPQPTPTITIDGDGYDVDWFGMDDGKDESPDAAFRFLFQIGLGMKTHLYVVQAGGQRGNRDAFGHHFWLKGILTIDMEPEDYGPPRAVQAAPMVLPLPYAWVTFGAPHAPRRLRILTQQFEAPSVDELTMRFQLEYGVRLLWSRSRGWEVEDGGTRSALGDDAMLAFDDPSPDRIGGP
jgi:hypothetical protein